MNCTLDSVRPERRRAVPAWTRGRAVFAALALALFACGVKAPPRPPTHEVIAPPAGPPPAAAVPAPAHPAQQAAPPAGPEAEPPIAPAEPRPEQAVPLPTNPASGAAGR